ncbi:MAG: aspartate racemase [Promethearchaeota archaeon CR_4]|nr:MAG: aspartate racemase [Candidatus Lokiarchaeota archaeon CR_4]
MRMLGLIGGTTWESTIIYYQRLNEMVQKQYEGVYSAPLILYSVEFNHVLTLMNNNQWDILQNEFCLIGKHLENAGAKALLICTNTIHKIADGVQKAVSIPLINIIEVTGQVVQNKGLKTIGLLGTRTTTEDPFFSNDLKQKFNINTVVPKPKDHQYLHDVIFTELARGILNKASKQECLRIIKEVEAMGAQGIILGCTELPLLIAPKDIHVPVFDTLELHIKAAFQFLTS